MNKQVSTSAQRCTHIYILVNLSKYFTDEKHCHINHHHITNNDINNANIVQTKQILYLRSFNHTRSRSTRQGRLSLAINVKSGYIVLIRIGTNIFINIPTERLSYFVYLVLWCRVMRYFSVGIGVSCRVVNKLAYSLPDASDIHSKYINLFMQRVQHCSYA